MVAYPIKALILPNIPNNAGSVSPIEVTAPAGCVLDAQPPAATGARFMVGHFVAPLVFGALAQVIPARVQADSGMTNIMNVIGRNPRGEEFTTLYFSAGGFGAGADMDGAADDAVAVQHDGHADRDLGMDHRHPRAVAGDAMNRARCMVSDIHPLAPSMRIVGQARTLQVPPGDNAAIHVAVALARPGDVLVIDAGGYLDVAVWGGILTTAAAVAAIGGVVLDGATRDSSEAGEAGLSLFCRGVEPRGAARRHGGKLGPDADQLHEGG
jgi:hypothetical protein